MARIEVFEIEDRVIFKIHGEFSFNSLWSEFIAHCKRFHGQNREFVFDLEHVDSMTICAVSMLRMQLENTVPLEEAKNMSPEELDGKIVTGVFVNRKEAEFCEDYDKLIERAMKK